MKKLIALLAAVGAVVFFWRKKQHAEEPSAWGSASDTASSWGESAKDKTSDAADAVADAVDDA
jgi:hypothetical protein